jgi:hypothetical protein
VSSSDRFRRRHGRRGVLEIHREAGPPRLTVVVHDGARVCDLEVAVDRSGGEIRHMEGWAFRVDHPPASGEWWLVDDDGRPQATVSRNSPVGERFHLELGGVPFDVASVGRWWRRRWVVYDAEERTVVEVVQRLLVRPVHDLHVRSGDLPPELAFVVAWLLAQRTSRGLTSTRRPRYGAATP